ncbi:unnamed protein product [Bursaphelenchus okinawaensis]|uniref:MFS domain-containing protein n=1 Tax=Bursaphelenchus okinawaensis TaxID=465554 RepID=A0A811L844_9BILA|nr:unnamed protein product [Bursaphelenchus okinawaensis]CAG9119057.1 unnamed protein product [Bursaphelenchus okinawaensis]
MDLLLRQSGPTLIGNRIQAVVLVSTYGFLYLNQVLFVLFLSQNGVTDLHKNRKLTLISKNETLGILDKPFLTFEFLHYNFITKNALLIVFFTYSVGNGIGYLFSALLSQNLSPRKGLIIFTFVHVITSFISAVCPIFWAYNGFRFFSGFLSGAASHCLLCILVDWSYPKFNAVTGHHVNVGKVLAFLLSSLVILVNLGVPWRITLLGQGILTFIGFVATMIWVHQSPRWLKERNEFKLLMEEGKQFAMRIKYDGRPLLEQDYNANEPSYHLEHITPGLERVCLVLAYGFSSSGELLVQSNFKVSSFDFKYCLLMLAGLYLISYLLSIPSRRVPRFGVSSAAVFGSIITFLIILIKKKPLATLILTIFKNGLAITANQLMFMTLLNSSTPFDDPTNAQLVHSRIKLVVLADFAAGMVFRPAACPSLFMGATTTHRDKNERFYELYEIVGRGFEYGGTTP